MHAHTQNSLIRMLTISTIRVTLSIGTTSMGSISTIRRHPLRSLQFPVSVGAFFSHSTHLTSTGRLHRLEL